MTVRSTQKSSQTHTVSHRSSDVSETYLEVLNPEQRAAVEHEGSPLLILAGAGSGKTRVITTKIAWLIKERGVNPSSILAVTFTKKAAKEMQERAVMLEDSARYAQIKTFHSFGAWFLRLYGESENINSNFTVYDDEDTVTLVSKSNPSLTRQQAKHFARSISLCKDYCYLPENLNEIAAIESNPDFPRIYENYQKRLRQSGNVDFGDLILLPCQILSKNENIRTCVQNRFKVIMVDEYQDSNIAQFKLLSRLFGQNSYICVVGDDDQSIYKFRGAEIQNILQFQTQFPGTQVIRLERNYRSTSEILSIADDVVKNNRDRLGKTLVSERGKGKQPVLAFLSDQDEEVRFCADLILQSKKLGASFCDWAVLYRTNAQSLGFESEFLRRKIPYSVVGSLKFYEREEIKDLLSYLALLANARDEIAFRRIVNKPARGVGSSAQEKIVADFHESYALSQDGAESNCIESCRKIGKTLSKKARSGAEEFLDGIDLFKKTLAENEKNAAENKRLSEENAGGENEKKLYKVEKLSALIELIAEKSRLKEYHEAEDEIASTQRVLNMQELSNSAVFYDCTTAGLIEFLEHIELDRTVENPGDRDETDRVTLITLHNTKGLEFNRVLMTGMEYGIFPRMEKYGEELEEERRLCYVGITRAKDELYMTACQKRRVFGRTEFMSPSIFLKEILPEKLKILGHVPFGFSPAANTSRNGDYGAYGLSHPDTGKDPLKQKYCRGAKIFHDDYGYGAITSAVTTDGGEYRITVQFESGGIKNFLPQYQEKSLLVIGD